MNRGSALSEQQVLEFAADYLLAEQGGHADLSGRRIRAKFSGSDVADPIIGDLVKKGWLLRQGTYPKEVYTLSAEGFLASSHSTRFLALGNEVLQFLRERYDADPDIPKYTWADLETRSGGGGGPEQFYPVMHVIRVARLEHGGGGILPAPGQRPEYNWGVPLDFERVGVTPTFEARLGDLAAARQLPKPVTQDQSEQRPSHPPKRTAVILTALNLECQAVLSRLRGLRTEQHGAGTIYEVGTTPDGSWQVAVAVIGMGNESAAAHAERACAHFRADVLVLVGVAGGLKDVAVGDVVVATKVYGFEYGKDGDFFLPRPAVGECSHRLQQLAYAEARSNRWNEQNGGRSASRLLVGPIAAGAKVVADSKSPTAQLLRQSYSDALAVEMEGLGIVAALQLGSVAEAVVVRGISDLVDGKAASDAGGWQDRAAANAAAVAVRLLESYVDPPTRSSTSAAASPAVARPPAAPVPVQNSGAWLTHDAERGTTRYFERRMQGAFPGVRGLQSFDGADADDRFTLLLSGIEPSEGYYPIWWFRGNRSNAVDAFARLDGGIFLMEGEEFALERVYVYRDPAHWRCFVYVECAPLPQQSRAKIDSQQMLELFGYVDEEYALWQGHVVSREEYDDGAAVIDGKVVQLDGADLRTRYLSPYNFVLAGQFSPLNDVWLDAATKTLMNQLLLSEARVEDLVELVQRRPRRERVM